MIDDDDDDDDDEFGTRTDLQELLVGRTMGKYVCIAEVPPVPGTPSRTDLTWTPPQTPTDPAGWSSTTLRIASKRTLAIGRTAVEYPPGTMRGIENRPTDQPRVLCVAPLPSRGVLWDVI